VGAESRQPVRIREHGIKDTHDLRMSGNHCVFRRTWPLIPAGA